MVFNPFIHFPIRPVAFISILFLLIGNQLIFESNALRQSPRTSSVQSDLIDEIDAKKLEKLVQEKESVALYLCTCFFFLILFFFAFFLILSKKQLIQSTDPRSCSDECQKTVDQLEEVCAVFSFLVSTSKFLRLTLLLTLCFWFFGFFFQINDEANEFGIFLVRNSERAVAKQYDISKIPSLVYFKHNNDPSIYSGKLKSNQNMI